MHNAKTRSMLVLIALLLGAFLPGSMGASGRALAVTLVPKLSPYPSWTYNLTQLGIELGQSVAPAGDVNGDGYADILVTAPKHSGDVDREGLAMVFLGGAGGLQNNPAWTAASGQKGSYYGNAAHTAFDVNGDGCDDVLIGARQYKNVYSEEGAAFLYYGTPTGVSPSYAWAAFGGQKDAWFGNSVGPAGDVNHDGFADVVVGARYYTDKNLKEGALFIYYGSENGLSEEPDQVFYGGKASAQLGYSAIYAGDINNDGIDDLVAGAPYYNAGLGGSGAVFVFFGSEAGLAPAPDSPLVGGQVGMGLGASVYPAGDINQDGYADIVAGAPFYTGEESRQGAAYLYYGSPDGLYPIPQWELLGDHGYAYFGAQVGSTALFKDGDFGAVLVGEPSYTVTDAQAIKGRIYLYLGSSSGPSPQPFWFAEGDKANAYLGTSLAAAGDVNGNGMADIVAGAPEYRISTNITGRAFAYYVLRGDESFVFLNYLPFLTR